MLHGVDSRQALIRQLPCPRRFPELVKEDDKGIKSVNYIGLIPVAGSIKNAAKRN
jgi:hypothetical protein